MQADYATNPQKTDMAICKCNTSPMTILAHRNVSSWAKNKHSQSDTNLWSCLDALNFKHKPQVSSLKSFL